MEKKDMIEVLVDYYCGGNKARFAAKLSIKPQTLSMWISRNSFDAEVIYKSCEGISADWLLTGEGDMLTASSNNAVANGDSSIAVNNNSGHIATGDTAVLQERVKSLEALLAEKERLIKVYEKMVGK